MQCPKCNTQLDDDTVFCGNCGTQVASLQARGATTVGEGEQTIQVSPASISYQQGAQPFSPPPAAYAPPLETPAQGNAPRPPARGRSSRLATPRFRILLALALIVLAGGTLGVLAILRNGSTTFGANASGQITFLDSSNGAGHTDALKISIQGLEAPSSGSQYDAWLVNSASEQIIVLGTLKANGQTFDLNYAGDGGNGRAGTNLIGAGDKVEVTLEQGRVTSPTGRVILSAVFPPKAFVHIKHLLFSFPITPGKTGLVVGLLNQVQLLDAQALLLQNASNSHNTGAVQCVVQSIIDIIEGAQGTAFQRLPILCLATNTSATGDGFGMLGSNGYVALAAQHASLAATQSDSTDLMRLHAGHVEIAMANLKGWLATIEQDALTLRSTPGNTRAIQEIVTLSDHVFHGVDTNGDERVDPVPGEAGAITAYNHAQLMASLQLVQ